MERETTGPEGDRTPVITEQKKKDMQELSSFVTKCFEGKGFVAFITVLTEKKDKNGDLVLDHYYLRSDMSFEDVKKALQEGRKAFLDDVNSL